MDGNKVGLFIFTFHCIQPVSVLLADQIDLSNIALAQQTDFDKAARRDLDRLFLDRVGRIGSTESAPPEVQR